MINLLTWAYERLLVFFIHFLQELHCLRLTSEFKWYASLLLLLTSYWCQHGNQACCAYESINVLMKKKQVQLGFWKAQVMLIDFSVLCLDFVKKVMKLLKHVCYLTLYQIIYHLLQCFTIFDYSCGKCLIMYVLISQSYVSETHIFATVKRRSVGLVVQTLAAWRGE